MTDNPRLRRLAYRLLTRAVRGRRERGGEWGEAVLAEFDQTVGTRAALRWTASGLRVAWRDRRAAHRVRLAALSRPRRLARRLGYALPVAVAALLFTNAYLATVTFQASDAMSPTVPIGARVVVDRVSHHVTGLHHGDLVLVALTIDGHRVPAVRRVIGLPGDRVECVAGQVRRNGAELSEGYLWAGTRTSCDATTVAAGRLYLLGDDRIAALDSRELGTVADSAVTGRVLAVLH
jgi:signal peptidase I